MAAANVLFVLKNCYINTGKAIKKRPCPNLIATLEVGTVGLRAAGGKLNTFYTGTAVTHADTLFRANRVNHPSAALAVVKAHYGENFNGFLYCAIEYSDGSIRHHYLDDPGAWAVASAYAVGVFRRPTAANGFRYEVTAIAGTGTSGGVEPAWPTTVGTTVVDNAGANQITWTCRSFAIVDANCPNSKQVEKIGEKLYAAAGANVRFCAAALPRDWTAANDAGFLASGINAVGSDTVTALGEFRGDLGVFYSDSTQLWTVDPDPTLNAIKSNAGNIGTLHYATPQPFADDLVFLAKPGFRSVTLSVLADIIEENDIGSPIDALRGEIADSDSPISVYFPRHGQLWIVNNTRAYVLTYSKKSKITAWSIYDFSVTFTDMAVLNNELYGRSGNQVYRFDENVFTDTGIAPLCQGEMFFQDNKLPGIMKQFTGFDAAFKGSPSFFFKYDPRYPTLKTSLVPMAGGPTRPVYYLDLPGIAGNYASSPDSAVSRIVADIDIRARIAPAEWRPPASTTSIIGKWVEPANQRSYILQVAGGANAGKLLLAWSPDGVNPLLELSTVANVFADGTPHWVRATFNVNDGAGNYVVKFYTSEDGIAWTQLGATITTAGITSIFESSSILEIGSHSVGTAQLNPDQVYRAQIFKGIDGIKVVDFEPRLIDKRTMKGVMWAGERWTVNTAGAVPAAIGFAPAAVTAPQAQLLTDTRPGELMPMEIASVAVAPCFQHQANEDFQLDMVQCYYEALGPT